MRLLIMVFVLCFVLVFCSGCGPVIGGIIGYQSGEMVAGAAIGAGVEYGVPIVKGVGECGGALAEGFGEMVANPVKDIEKANIDSDAGRIELPKASFTAKRLRCMSDQMQSKFTSNHWKWRLVKRRSNSGNIKYQEEWACETKVGYHFRVLVTREKSRDATLKISSTEDKNRITEITSQIFVWLEEIVKKKKC